MASFVLTDAYISIGGVDLSDHGSNITLSYEAEVQDDTAFGDTTRSGAGGLLNWGMEGTLLQDFATGSVDLTLFTLVGSTTTCTVRAIATGGVSATNPNFTGLGLITSYPPIGGSVGDMAGTSVSIVAAGTLSRATS